MNFKILFLIFLFSISCLLVAQETIIDSVYSNPVLDGYIKFSQNAQSLSVNNWMYDMGAGDTWGVFPIEPDQNSYFRSFISFELPDIPEGYYIDSVYVRFYQFISGGHDASLGQHTDFPVWNVTNGDTIKCIMSHIDYGDELDVGDWDKGDLGNSYTFENNLGTITDSGYEGYRYLGITTAVRNDYDAVRDKSQYRIAFQIDTDWDGETDQVAFMTSSGHSYTALCPTLYITYTNEIQSINENTIDEQNIICANIHPNPIILSQSNATKISYELAENSSVKLQIYNIKGQLLETIVNERKNAGKHFALWDASKCVSGIYLYKIMSGKKAVAGKCLVLK